MAKHYVNYSIPLEELGKQNIEFYVYHDDEKLGTLMISKGAVVWKPGKNKKNAFKMTWSYFDEVMQKNGHKMQGK